jgi:para-aminobenzoate synthetase component II
MKILVIDNYDSFTYNLVQILLKLKQKVIVKQDQDLTVSKINKLKPDKILIGPGPGKPEERLLSLQIIAELGKTTPVLGVCLGHQVIAVSFNGKVVKADNLMHGKISTILHDNKRIFKKIPQNFPATRYNSLIVDKESLPTPLIVTAESEKGEIMGIRHKKYPIEGVQFHPDSVLTTEGEAIINNWINL